MQPTVNIYATRDEVSAALSAHISLLAAKASAERGRFCVALSGGSLMDLITTALSSEPFRGKVDWSSWHVFWADERWVPWSSPESNYGSAKDRFLSRVSIPSEQIHAVDTSLTPSETAQHYESLIESVLKAGGGQVPRFDLVLLGLGEDGHTASLFPGHPALMESSCLVVPVQDAPKPPPLRITMTLPLINSARNVAFVATGPDKANILSKVLKRSVEQVEVPAGRVNPCDGTLEWFIDRAAAADVASIQHDKFE